MKISDPIPELQRMHFPSLPVKRASFLRQNKGFDYQRHRIFEAEETDAGKILIKAAEWKVFRYGEKR